jgi:protein-S-isoprenylcysteine O-methyltransferase Ste14
MTALPSLQLAVSNVWLLLVAYGIGFLLALRPFSKAEKVRLFADPKKPLRGIKRVTLHFGQFVAFAFIVLMVFTPVTRKVGPLLLGIAIYVGGYFTVVVALRYFRLANEGQPAKDGPYRVSRNPQWVGLFLVLMGTAILSAAWLPFVMVLVVGCIYHLQILEEENACASLYGADYINYLHRVPRYFLWV